MHSLPHKSNGQRAVLTITIAPLRRHNRFTPHHSRKPTLTITSVRFQIRHVSSVLACYSVAHFSSHHMHGIARHCRCLAWTADTGLNAQCHEGSPWLVIQ